MKITVLDLGSSSFHVQVFQVDALGEFRTLFGERRAIHLGRDVYGTGRIGESKWQQALTTVGELLEASRVFAADVTIAVATSALRDAANGLAFRVELWNRYRLSVQLLTPEQEARFSYLGASTTAQVGGRRVAVLDLGGGSLEVAVGGGTRCLLAESLPLGALHVHERIRHGDGIGSLELGRLHELVRSVARELLSQVRALSPELVVFASGTARSARQALLTQTLMAGKVGPIDVATLRHAIGEACGNRARANQTNAPAIDDTVLVAGSIMLAVMEMLDADRAIVSDKGLRDGVALDVYRCAPRPTVNAPARVWNRRMAGVSSVPSNLARRD